VPVSVSTIIDALTRSGEITVRSAGETILAAISDGTVSADAFGRDPRILGTRTTGISRYLAQVAWRAVNGEYRTVEEIVAGLEAVVDRAPPLVHPTRSGGDRLRAIPEARVLRIRPPVRDDDGWRLVFEALVTSGDLAGEEVVVSARSVVAPGPAETIALLWVHASVAAYNLAPEAGGSRTAFEATPETFLVIEPLRQVNATSIARGLDCPKPHVDRLRRGRGDVTVHTLKGMIVHGIWDRLIAGQNDVAAAYREVLPSFLAELAAIAGDGFDETGFRADVLAHGEALGSFIDRNPHVREDAQVELRRYSATLGIQGRIDAVFRGPRRLDVVELKTGKRIRAADHAQLAIYRLLLRDFVLREQESDPSGSKIDVSARLVSSVDGSSTPLAPVAGFGSILAARNRLVAHGHALGRSRTHLRMPYAGYDDAVCGRCPSWTATECRRDSRVFGDDPESGPPDAALEYFNRMTILVQRERGNAEQELADLVDDSRLAYRLRQSRAIAGAECVAGEAGAFTFEFDRNTSDLGSRDRVLIHSGDISRLPAFHGYVREIGPRRVRVAVPIERLDLGAFSGRQWIIDRFPSDLTSGPSQTGLYDFLRSPGSARKRAILGDFFPDPSGASGDHPPPTAITADGAGVSETRQFRAELNPDQTAAVNAALDASVFHLVWGPPGTGKTRVTSEIVRHAAGARTPARGQGGVLLAAPTNTAVDRMLLALLEAAPDLEFVRLGSAVDSPELGERLGARAGERFSQDLASTTPGARELRRRLDAVRVFATTAHRAGIHPYLRRREFDLSVVDEASQLTEPMTLGVIMRARRFVLVGDDRQLPPVTREEGLRVSMFERLKQAATRHAPERVTLLRIQYRMHPEIMGVSNRLYYGGALESGVTAAERRPIHGRPVRFVPVEADVDGRSNPREVDAVRRVVEELLEAGLGPREIGVIAPFRAQVFLLRAALESTGVVADTVERFQGGEREAIVLSLVRSRFSRFVLDERRFNVAITRARTALVLVGHPRLFADTPYAWLASGEATRSPDQETRT
jgi:DNA replication ATP-dependent helicase Dna2